MVDHRCRGLAQPGLLLVHFRLDAVASGRVGPLELKLEFVHAVLALESYLDLKWGGRSEDGDRLAPNNELDVVALGELVSDNMHEGGSLRAGQCHLGVDELLLSHR